MRQAKHGASLSFTLLLAACGTTLTLGHGTQTTSGKPLICAEVAPVEYSDGKYGPASRMKAVDWSSAQKDAQTLLADPDPELAVRRVKNLVGDTQKTKDQVEFNNAKWHALCD